MDEAKLSEIEARAKAATEGPWSVGEEFRTHVVDGAFAGDDRLPVASQPSNGLGATAWDEANATFIAHAREDVPALVAEVRRLREVNAGLVRLLKDGGLIG